MTRNLRKPLVDLGRGLVALLVVTVAQPAAAQELVDSPLPSVELPAALDRVLREYEEAWQNRDAEALTRLFAPDGFVLPPGRPPMRGHEAIRAHYEGRGGPLSLRALAYAMEGGVGYIIGGYSAGPDLPDGGKFVLTLRMEPEGRWLIVSDMDNGNR